MWAAKPWAVSASATACIAERSERCPAARASPVSPAAIARPYVGADLLGHRLGLVRGAAGRAPARAGPARGRRCAPARRRRRVGDGDVALRRAPGPAAAGATAAADDLDVAAGGELVEVVAGDVGVDADLGGHGRRRDAVVAAVVAGEQVDPPAGRIAEGVGDRRHGGGERRAGRRLRVAPTLAHGGASASRPSRYSTYGRSANSAARHPLARRRSPMPATRDQIVEALRPGAGPRAAPLDRRPRHGARRRRRPPTAASRVLVALTVPGCPLKNEIRNRVDSAVGRRSTASRGVAVDFTVMTDQEREDAAQPAARRRRRHAPATPTASHRATPRAGRSRSPSPGRAPGRC